MDPSGQKPCGRDRTISTASSGVADDACARFFEATQTALAVVGFDGSLHHVNPAWSARIGVARPPGSLLDHVVAADRAPLMRALTILRPGEAMSVAVRFVGQDGAEHAFACELTADADRPWIYVMAHARKDGPASEAETLFRALDATEELGLYMIDAADDGTARVLYANAGVERVWGISGLRERARAGDLTHAEVARRAEGMLAAASAEGDRLFARSLPDGRSVAWLEIPVEDGCGEPRARLYFCKEVTERKLAQSAAAAAHERQRRSEAEFRRLLEYVPDGIVVMRDGKFVYANPAAARILGYDAPQELVGIHFASVVRPEELPESHERVRRMSAGAPAPRSLRPMVRRDGTTVYAETLGFPTEFDGAPATLVIAHDVTEERRLASQIRQAEHLASLGTLAATLAHEINNPLTYILLNLQVIRRSLARLSDDHGSSLAADALRLADETLEGADRVRVIVRDLRAFARPDDDTKTLVDVRAVLESVIPIAAHELRSRAAVVRAYDGERGEPMVVANDAVLGQVFLNLLVNAAQAIPDDARQDHEVRIGVRTAEAADGSRREVVVTIRDTGEGMSRAVRERIFEPFFTTKAAGAGSGLGLSLCVRNVHALGGEIAVESDIGHGSTFTVRLPLAPPPAAAEPDVARPAAPLPRLKILVVDDEPRIAERLAEILGAHDVAIVSSGRDALARLRDERFDAIFCDLMMPEMKGTDVFEQACRQQPDLAPRFVFMTAGAFTPRARALLDRGSNPRLDKPFTAAEVQKVLSLVVGPDREREPSTPP